MKAYIMQPPYSRDVTREEELFQWKMDALDKCAEDVDIIVLPEYSDVPVVTATLEETLAIHKKNIGTLLDKCIQTARRCHAMVFVNALSLEEGGYRNTTYCYDREGNLRGKYFKKHLPPLEMEALKLDSDYTMEPSFPYVLEMEGLRFGFMTCYDFYFYEAFARVAREKVDIIIGCSLQRSDSHDALEVMCRFLAYNTNAYVLRSSVSFDEASTICGASMAVSPEGKVLMNLGGRFAAETVDFDPAKKYIKPLGFGNGDGPHYEYLEYGRKPWQYRPGGTAIIRNERTLPYPRVCAHRGFSAVAPENSLPAFGAAIGLGAEEIEFDLWPTKDGEIVSCHDKTLDRVSTGTGLIYEHTFEELQKLDFGGKFNEHFKGLPVLKFEEILQRFSCHTIMNIHVKPLGEHYDPAIMRRIVDLIRRYDAQEHVYFMLEKDDDVALFRSYAPEIPICLGHDKRRPWELVERAIAVKADKVQLFKPYISQEMVDKAHAHGILCNVFYADDEEEVRQYLDMGIDTVLTNDYLKIKLVKERLAGE
ncbi:MAG: hypothetical protein II343_07295 [Clostridia bacterium]|nr:hypothetical protein [Clostridia bacterium]